MIVKKFALIRMRLIFAICALLLLSCSAYNDETLVIPFSIERGWIILDAAINGQAGRFVLDTGMIHSLAEVCAQGLRSYGYVEQLIDGRLQMTPYYMLRSIQFGDIEVTSRSWLINRNDFIERIRLRGFDGLLGLWIFEGYWVELSFSRNEIVLHRQKPEHFSSASHSPLKLPTSSSALHLPITIDGMEFLMNIDTGLQSALFFPNDIVNYRNPEDLSRIASNCEIGDFYLVQTNSISVLDRTYNGKLIMNNSYLAERTLDPHSTGIGLLGLDFMRHYDFLLDCRSLLYGRTTGMYYMPITSSEERDYGFFSFLKEAPELGIINFRFSEMGMEITCILVTA